MKILKDIKFWIMRKIEKIFKPKLRDKDARNK